YFSRPSSLLSCLQASHRFHGIALFMMYRDPNIKTPKVSSITRFFDTLDQNPELKSLVRTFDITRSALCGYNLTSEKISRLPRLRDLRLSLSHVKDVGMLHKLLFGLPGLEALTLDALASIPSSARLTHLNIWGCRDLDLDRLVEFLVSHPAVKDSLAVLKAGYIADGAPLSERQINKFLSQAPRTLRSLDLSMSNMGPSNIPHLQKLCTQLEELSVGQNLDMYDIESILLKPRYDFEDEYRSYPARELTKEEAKHEAILEPMRNALAMCRLRRRLDSVTVSDSKDGKKARESMLRYLNLSSIPAEEQGQIKQSVLFGKETGPLEVVEVADIPWEDFGVLGRLCGAVGWREEWEDKRVWVERL
ncbi:hypothetical protein DL98DRAFT_426740, partial [Cadophora sp. DSE1049]